MWIKNRLINANINTNKVEVNLLILLVKIAQ
jgi:hypothetical protein